MEIKRIIEDLLIDNVDFGIAVEHIESGESFDINGDDIFPTASVFKVPVMVEVFKQARQGKFDLDDRLELKTKYKTLTTGVLLTLQDGLQPSIRDLLMLMTIVSDNTATTMLMELVGAENVTRTMHALGLPTISVKITVHEMFLHAFGIPGKQGVTVEKLQEISQKVEMDYNSLTFSKSSENDVCSARDMTRLMSMIQKQQVIDEDASLEMIEIMRNQQHTNRVPRYLPWRSVANKTGSMRGLRNDSGIITCSTHSHVAYSVFSFDRTPLGVGDRQSRSERADGIEKLFGEIGLLLYEKYKAVVS